jgi:hypothetical protein
LSILERDFRLYDCIKDLVFDGLVLKGFTKNLLNSDLFKKLWLIPYNPDPKFFTGTIFFVKVFTVGNGTAF